MWDVMEKDETFLGKIPEITKEEFNNIVSNRLKDKKELSYLTFRLILDEFPWRLINRRQAHERADKLYQTANDLLRANKDSDALNECIKAIGLTKYF